jgi:hypothetical protein
MTSTSAILESNKRITFRFGYWIFAVRGVPSFARCKTLAVYSRFELETCKLKYLLDCLVLSSADKVYGNISISIRRVIAREGKTGTGDSYVVDSHWVNYDQFRRCTVFSSNIRRSRIFLTSHIFLVWPGRNMLPREAVHHAHFHLTYPTNLSPGKQSLAF